METDCTGFIGIDLDAESPRAVVVLVSSVDRRSRLIGFEIIFSRPQNVPLNDDRSR